VEATKVSNKKRVNFLLDEQQKERWEQVAENEGYGTLTTLIIQSVQHELNDNWGYLPAVESTGGDGDNSDVTDRLSGIEGLLTEVTDRLDRIEGEQQASDDMAMLMNLVLDELPAPPDAYGDVPIAEFAATPEDIADSLDANVLDVRKALNQLSRETGQVAEGENEAAGMWWVRE
jgi:hypothetical protein